MYGTKRTATTSAQNEINSLRSGDGMNFKQDSTRWANVPMLSPPSKLAQKLNTFQTFDNSLHSTTERPLNEQVPFDAFQNSRYTETPLKQSQKLEPFQSVDGMFQSSLNNEIKETQKLQTFQSVNGVFEAPIEKSHSGSPKRNTFQNVNSVFDSLEPSKPSPEPDKLVTFHTFDEDFKSQAKDSHKLNTFQSVNGIFQSPLEKPAKETQKFNKFHNIDEIIRSSMEPSTEKPLKLTTNQHIESISRYSEEDLEETPAFNTFQNIDGIFRKSPKEPQKLNSFPTIDAIPQYSENPQKVQNVANIFGSMIEKKSTKPPQSFSDEYSQYLDSDHQVSESQQISTFHSINDLFGSTMDKPHKLTTSQKPPKLKESQQKNTLYSIEGIFKQPTQKQMKQKSKAAHGINNNSRYAENSLDDLNTVRSKELPSNMFGINSILGRNVSDLVKLNQIITKVNKTGNLSRVKVLNSANRINSGQQPAQLLRQQPAQKNVTYVEPYESYDKEKDSKELKVQFVLDCDLKKDGADKNGNGNGNEDSNGYGGGFGNGFVNGIGNGIGNLFGGGGGSGGSLFRPTRPVRPARPNGANSGLCIQFNLFNQCVSINICKNVCRFAK